MVVRETAHASPNIVHRRHSCEGVGSISQSAATPTDRKSASADRGHRTWSSPARPSCWHQSTIVVGVEGAGRDPTKAAWVEFMPQGTPWARSHARVKTWSPNPAGRRQNVSVWPSSAGAAGRQHVHSQDSPGMRRRPHLLQQGPHQGQPLLHSLHHPQHAQRHARHGHWFHGPELLCEHGVRHR